MGEPPAARFAHRDRTGFTPRLPLAVEHTPQLNRSSGRPMRILLIDGARTITRTMSVALEADGHEAVAVESSSGALRQVQKAPFDVASSICGPDRKMAWRCWRNSSAPIPLWRL